MPYTITLNKEDYLTYYLYTASKKKTVRRQMNGNWVWLSLSFFILGISFYFSNNITLSLFFIVTGIATMIFYPFYQKNHYLKHYRKHVDEMFNGELSKTLFVNFEEDHIEAKNADAESKIKFTSFEKISETSHYIFIYLKNKQGIPFPKNMVDFTTFNEELKFIAKKHNVIQVKELNWKW